MQGKTQLLKPRALLLREDTACADRGGEFPLIDTEKVDMAHSVSAQVCGATDAPLTEKGRAQTEMTIPAYHEGKEIIAIGEYAFRDCEKLARLTVQRNITSIYSKAFAKCPTLKTVRLETQGSRVLVNNETLLDETHASLQFSVNSDNYVTFVSDYFWTPYASRFIVEE